MILLTKIIIALVVLDTICWGYIVYGSMTDRITLPLLLAHTGIYIFYWLILRNALRKEKEIRATKQRLSKQGYTNVTVSWDGIVRVVRDEI